MPKSAGSCLGLTIGWMMLRARFPDHPVVDALGVMPFFIGMLLSARYTYLKGRPAAVQAIFIGAGTLLFALFFVVVSLIAGRSKGPDKRKATGRLGGPWLSRV
jgi:hypothetical protein